MNDGSTNQLCSACRHFLDLPRPDRETIGRCLAPVPAYMTVGHSNNWRILEDQERAVYCRDFAPREGEK